MGPSGILARSNPVQPVDAQGKVSLARGYARGWQFNPGDGRFNPGDGSLIQGMAGLIQGMAG